MRTELFNQPWLSAERPTATINNEKIALNPDEHIDLKIENVRKCFEGKHKRLHDQMFDCSGRLSIVAGGPSAKLLDIPRPIMTCGTAYVTIDNPEYAVFYDPLQENTGYMKELGDTHFLVASMCNPTLFDRLKDCEVSVWNAAGDVPHEEYNGEPFIGGGSMVPLRALPIAMIMGFDEFDFYGLDCSFENEMHSYNRAEYGDDTGYPEHIDVSVAGKHFRTTPQLVCQAQQFVTMERLRKFKARVHGDGMLAWARLQCH